MASYYRINSSLKSPTGFNYIQPDGKDRNGKPKAKSIRVVIQGAYRPGDQVPPTYITGEEYKNLIKIKSGQTSAFSLLLEQGQLGKPGILSQECSFENLPPEIQKKYDPKGYAKIESARSLQNKKAEKAEKDEKNAKDAED